MAGEGGPGKGGERPRPPALKAGRFYRFLAHLWLPRDFREEFLIDLELLMEDRLGEAATRSERAVVRMRGWVDLVGQGVRLRWDGWRGSGAVRGSWHREGGMGGLLDDLKMALRGARRRPLLAGAVAGTVGLAVGACTAVFTLVNAILLEPLAYPDPDRLVMVWEHNLPRDRARNVVSPANFFDWREQAGVFDGLAAMMNVTATLTVDGEPERVGGVMASGDFFPLMGVTPRLGRLPGPGDEAPDAAPVVALSHGFWQRRFGGDPDVVGRTLVINDQATTVVGVLPPEFDFRPPEALQDVLPPDLWVPAPSLQGARTARGRVLQVVGRLAPGVSLQGAADRMVSLASALEAEHPEYNTGWSARVVPLRQEVVGDVRATLLLLLGAVGGVLLIACSNVANLLLSRGWERSREVAVRAALGADRGRIVRGFLVEAAVLAGAGGVLGVAAAAEAVRRVVAAVPALPRAETVALDARVLLFALAVTLLTGLVCGIAPALQGGRQANLALRQRGGSGGRARRVRQVLVVAQVSLSLVLLVGSGLLVRSVQGMLRTGVGVDPRGVLLATVELRGSRYPDGPSRAEGFGLLVDAVRAIPGVEAASAITFPPLGGTGSATTLWRSDGPVPPPGEGSVADIRWIREGFPEALGLQVVSGRAFDAGDDAAAPLRIVVNEAAARHFWPGEDPIGRSLTIPWDTERVSEVVGVVADAAFQGPAVPVRPMVYWHQAQVQDFTFMSLVVRSSTDPEILAPAVRRAVAEVDPSLAVYAVSSLGERLRETVAPARITAAVLTAFAVVALALSGLGVYAVIAFNTGRRMHEFGVRMALGSKRSALVLLAAREGALLVALALAVGLAAALAGGELMRGMVFGVAPRDPLTLAGTALLLGVVGLVASVVPALRAGRVDPLEAVREE